MTIVVDKELPSSAFGFQTQLSATWTETHPVAKDISVLQTWNVTATALHNDLLVLWADLSVIVPLLMGSAQDNSLSATMLMLQSSHWV